MDINLAYIVIVLGVILLSMTLHEAMHAFAGYWLGDTTARDEGRLTLNPIKHIDPFLTILLPLMLALFHAPIFGGAKPVPFNPERVRYGEYGAALVGLAGPFTNFVLAFVFFAFYAIFGQSSGLLSDFLIIGCNVNLGFFIFNMLPIPPLDGSRALYAVAPRGVQQFMELLEQNGLVVVFLIVFLFSSQLGQFIMTVQTAIIQAFAALFGLK